MFLKLTHVVHSNNETVTAASAGDITTKKMCMRKNFRILNYMYSTAVYYWLI